MSVVIQIVGLDRVRAEISALVNLDKRSVLAVMAETVRTQTIRRINQTKTSPDGEAWAALAASTVARKGTDNILVDTGRLLGSISSMVFGDYAEVGTDLEYAKYHHYGGTSKKTGAAHPPKRQFLGVSDTDSAELERVVTAHIKAILAL